MSKHFQVLEVLWRASLPLMEEDVWAEQGARQQKAATEEANPDKMSTGRASPARFLPGKTALH